MKFWNLLLASASSLLAQSTESVEFAGPESAPIYVIEGQFSQDYSVGAMGFAVDWTLAMEPNSGVLAGTGLFSVNGSFVYGYSSYGIDFDGAVAVALTAKQAGTILRVSGKMALTGTGNIAGFPVDRCSINYNYSNLQVNPENGVMSGFMSARGTARVPGYGTFPITIPLQSIEQVLPDMDSDGQWDSTGEWTEEINATVDAKGRIAGTGELAVLDDNGEPYDLISQKISGNVKNGTVSLSAAGDSRSTSRIKVNLTYLQSNDEAVANKSAVSAYGQTRKF